jgi:hypothetical protein
LSAAYCATFPLPDTATFLPLSVSSSGKPSASPIMRWTKYMRPFVREHTPYQSSGNATSLNARKPTDRNQWLQGGCWSHPSPCPCQSKRPPTRCDISCRLRTWGSATSIDELGWSYHVTPRYIELTYIRFLGPRRQCHQPAHRLSSMTELDTMNLGR